MHDKSLLVKYSGTKKEITHEIEFPSTAASHKEVAVKGKKKREKSLGQLCIQFIELFVNKFSEISLEQAGLILSPSISFDYHKIKTKVRRLYDIANVLQALNLIEKILLQNNKPGFRWLGYKGFLSFLKHQQKKNEQNEVIKGSDKKHQKIFTISQEPFAHAVKAVPGIKRFKPKVLQVGSPFFLKEKVSARLDLVSVRTLKFTQKEGIDELSMESNNLSLLLKAVEKK